MKTIWWILLVLGGIIVFVIIMKMISKDSDDEGILGRAKNILNFGCKKTKSGYRI